MSADPAAVVIPPKFSRYRSVRANGRNTSANTIDSKPSQDVGVKRSPSRYHRPPGGKSGYDKVAADTPAIPAVPRAATMPLAKSENVEALVQEKWAKIAQKSDLQRRGPLEELEYELKAQGRRHAEALESARQVAREQGRHNETRPVPNEGETIRRARTFPIPSAGQMSEEEAAEILEIQKQKDLERLQRELDNASPPKSSSPPPTKERFHIFSRKRNGRKESATPSPPLSVTTLSRRTSENTVPEPQKRSSNILQEPMKPNHVRERPQIEGGGGGIVPGIDAPVSAVNSGERRVLIRCKQSSINLPVTPSTTPNEIIYTAANILSQNIDPDKAILLESYTKLGLERGIRRYEHLRDIMNSWDRDTSNALVLEPSPSTAFPASNPLSNLAYLDSEYVSPEVPGETSVYLYHSQKPGRWNKRHVTLLPSGQIYMSKNLSAKMSDKDSTTLCHLSDFDIFIPTSSQVRKNLRPPKKICYAVKSQEKTSFFETTENFVHFFNTDDEKVARKWWNAVQMWRSWYLLHNRGRSKKEGVSAIVEPATPYQTGTFEPLIDPTDFPSRRRSRTIDDANVPNGIQDSTRPSRSKYPPISSAISKIRSNDENALSNNQSRNPPDNRETFAPQGLLGRSYTVKQKEIQEKEEDRQREGPFVAGNSLLNGNSSRSGTMIRKGSISRPSIDAPRPGTSGKSAERPKTSHAPPNRTQNQPPLSSSERTRTLSGSREDSGRTRSMSGNAQSFERTRTMTGNGNSFAERTRTMTQGNKPLVDLSKPPDVPKQWSKEGKGRGVRAPEGVLLVEAARTRSRE